ncbi:hypothetical protein ACFYX8_24010 [Streptomyces cyaneofuscatus]|uniref:hypothetical protein n=1 Tax=Streptomyces TaxID=1883 RepID=UPI001EF1213F|nr:MULTISPECIES: hypothetical protein [unclassified Streptomyces]
MAALAGHNEGGTVGFWSLQRQSWGTVRERIVGAWNGRTRVGFLVALAAVAATGAIAGPQVYSWAHSDDIVISTHKNGAEVPRCVRSFGGTGTLSGGHRLWVAVEFRDVNGDDRILFSRRATTDKSGWHADKVDVGGEDQALSSYTITAVDVDQPTDTMLNSTLVDMSFSDAPTEKAGRDLWRISFTGYPSGADPVARVHVTRAPGEDKSCNELAGTVRKSL